MLVMASQPATDDFRVPAASSTAAMQHWPWNSASDLSRGLAPVFEKFERFLSSAGFDRAPWLTVAFGTGIAAWFELPDATAWLVLCGLCALASGLGFAPWSRRDRFPFSLRAMAVVPLLVIAGCLAVWARSTLVGEPAIDRPLAGTFTARVLAVEEQPAMGRDRLLLAMRDPGSGRAIRVRLNVPDEAGAQSPASGDLVRFKARLMPPAPPMLPGAYDFARSAWFSGLSATGSVTGTISVVEHAGAGESRLAAFRAALARHVRDALGTGGEAGIAIAFVTGDRGSIDQSDADAMRDAGLAHLLSISGLHVSAVIGAAYVLAIRLLALCPWLALRVRLPVMAAAAGALAGLGYTLLTGSEVPTVRSCIGSLLVLAALALGREPLSLRMLSAAALCVLAIWPEALTGPSFQMSFGAVLAIVALSTAAPVRRFLAPRQEGWIARLARHVALLLVTGVVIELALMPMGLYHFHRAGVYGALANVVAIPLSTFVVMPLVALALVLDLVGAGAPVWWLAGHAIGLLLGLAHRIAALPGAVTLLPAAGTGAFVLYLAGALWLALWSGRARLLGLIPAMLGAGLLALAPTPDVLISGDGRHAGLYDPVGERLYVLRDGGPSYARDNLLEMAGMEGEPVLLATWPGARCNGDFCALRIRRAGRDWRLLISRGRDTVPERALAAACERADIVISDRWLARSCRPQWIKADRHLLSRSGGLAINLASGRVRTVSEEQGAHDWWRPLEPGKPWIAPMP